MLLDITKFPTPPAVVPWEGETLTVAFEDDIVLGIQAGAMMYKEKNHPPTFYFPRSNFDDDFLACLELDPEYKTECEFKGTASYYNYTKGDTFIPRIAWTYLDPKEGFEVIKEHLAFYPNKIECYVGEERVVGEDQKDFYGGWLWADIYRTQGERTDDHAEVEEALDKIANFINTLDNKDKLRFYLHVGRKEGDELCAAHFGFVNDQASASKMVEQIIDGLDRVAVNYGVVLRHRKYVFTDVMQMDMPSLGALFGGTDPE